MCSFVHVYWFWYRHFSDTLCQWEIMNGSAHMIFTTYYLAGGRWPAHRWIWPTPHICRWASAWIHSIYMYIRQVRSKDRIWWHRYLPFLIKKGPKTIAFPRKKTFWKKIKLLVFSINWGRARSTPKCESRVTKLTTKKCFSFTRSDSSWPTVVFCLTKYELVRTTKFTRLSVTNIIRKTVRRGELIFLI